MSWSGLIGTPYSEKNCLDIVKDFYRIELGVEIKHSFDGDVNDREHIKNLIYSNIGEFKKVDNPQYGDIILMKMRGLESHIGVYLDEVRFLHTSQTTNCVIDRLQRWDKVIVGFYRLEKT